MGTQKQALRHVAALRNGSRAMLRARGFAPCVRRATGTDAERWSSFAAASAPCRAQTECRPLLLPRDRGGIDTTPSYSYYSS
jgi:hypothetical protein